MPERAGGASVMRASGLSATATALALAFGLNGPAAAQASNWSASLTAATSYSDVRGRPGQVDDGQFVTDLSPGISWSSRSGRIQGSANYSLRARFHSDQSAEDSTQNSLSAAASAEVVDGWFFIDGRASISQQSVSAFGQPVFPDGIVDNGNRTEVRTVSLSPYVRGNLGGLATYEARYSASHTESSQTAGADSDSQNTSLSLASPSGGAVFGWNLNLTRSQQDFSSGADSTSDRAVAGLTIRPDIELQLGLNAGRESTDVLGPERKSYSNTGWTIRWTPTPRTSVGLQGDKRYFGRSHSLNLSHRMRRSTWVYTDTKGTTFGADGLSASAPVSLYALYDSIFTAQFPDPAERDRQVRTFLLASGLDPASTVVVLFPITSIGLQRQQALALALQWPRSTLSLRVYRNQTRSLQDGVGSLPDAAVSQHGYSSSASYRLTPHASLSLTGSRLMTPGNATQAGTDLKSLSLSLSNQLGRKVSSSLSLRYSVFNSPTDPYREAAVTASLSAQF